MKINFRQLTFYAAWLLCMGLTLALDFYPASAATLAVVAIIHLVRDVFGKGDKTVSISESLRGYLVSSCIVQLSSYICQNLEFFVSESTEDFYSFIRSLIFQHLIIYFNENWLIVILIMVAAVVLAFLRERFSETYLLYVVLKYFFRTALFSLLFYATTGNSQMILACVGCAAVFAFTDYIRRVHENINTNGGIRWFGLFCLALFVLMFFNYGIYEDLATLQAYELLAVFGKWYVFLPLMVVTVVAYVVTHCFLDSYKTDAPSEEMTYIAIASSLLVAFAAGCFYVGYGWIILAVYYVVMSLYLSNKGPRPGNIEKFRYDMKNYLPLPLMAIGFALCIIEGHFGKFAVALAFVLSVAFGIVAYNKLKPIKNSGLRNKWTYTTLLALIYVNTAARLWTFHMSAYLLIAMGVVCAVLIAIIWVANYNPDVYLENKYLKWFQYAVPALFVVLSLVAFAHGGSTVALELKGESSVIVSAEAHGEDNGVESLSYTWVIDSETFKNSLEENGIPESDTSMEDADEEETDTDDIEGAEDTADAEDATEAGDTAEAEEEPEKYVAISSGDEIELKTGLVKIVCQDENGIKTTVQRWCYVPEAKELPYRLPSFPVE